MNVKNLFFILIFLCIAHPTYPMHWARQFARTLFKRTAFAHPTTAAYLYAMRTYERRLDDDTVQQLHVGSDIHKQAQYKKDDFKQIEDFGSHMREQGAHNCFVATENHPTGAYSYFLHTIPKALDFGVAGVNLEFREKFLNPGGFFFRNNESIGEMLANFEHYADKFKEDALAKGILTIKDFEPLENLKAELKPHLHKTIYNLWQECGYNGFTFNSFETAYNSENTSIEKIKNISCKLIEDAAFYHIYSTNKPTVYLNMGGGHIERQNMKDAFILDDDLNERLKKESWQLTKFTGVDTASMLRDYSESKKMPAAINIAQHFASLPLRGSTLPSLTPAQRMQYHFPNFLYE